VTGRSPAEGLAEWWVRHHDPVFPGAETTTPRHAGPRGGSTTDLQTGTAAGHRPRRWSASTTRQDLALVLGVHVAARLATLAALAVAGLLVHSPGLRALERWDANWYRRIAEHGYGHVHTVPDGRTLVDYAFFPLYPWLEHVVASVTALSAMHAGLLLSAVCSCVAAVGIYTLTAQVASARAGVVTAALWSVTPVSVVQSMAYAESLLTALAAWSLVGWLRGRYVVAGLLAAFAGLTRPFGIAVAAALVASAVTLLVRERGEPHRPTGRIVAGAAVAPLGWLAYVGFVGGREHSARGYLDVMGAWGNRFDGGAAFVTWTVRLLGQRPVAALLLVAAVGVLTGQVWLLWRDRYPLPLVVFTALSVVAALTTSSYFGSKPRYLLPVFTLLIPAATRLSRWPGRRLTLLVCALGVLSACYGAWWLLGSGPP
jgi:hypothetical protein